MEEEEGEGGVDMYLHKVHISKHLHTSVPYLRPPSEMESGLRLEMDMAVNQMLPVNHSLLVQKCTISERGQLLDNCCPSSVPLFLHLQEDKQNIDLLGVYPCREAFPAQSFLILYNRFVLLAK